MGEKPNILFLLNDHQSFYGHGEMSGGPKIHRPNFERLAREGIEKYNLIKNEDSSRIIEDMKLRLKKWRERTNDKMDKQAIRKIITQKSQ